MKSFLFRNNWVLVGIFLITISLTETALAKANIVLSDIVTIDRIGQSEDFFAGGYRGFLGKIKVTDRGATFKKIPAPLDLDILVIKALSKNEAIIGSSKGEIYFLDNGALKRVKRLSEHKDPIMDIAINGNDIWVVAPRGVVGHSKDRGKTWQLVEIGSVLKTVILESGEATMWYLGATNVDVDSLRIKATKKNKKLVDDEDYFFNADGGILEVVEPLDKSSDLSVTFNYRPGPQFQAGDVSLNSVSFMGDSVLIAGEFGTVITLNKDGQWVSLYNEIKTDDSNMPYWIESSVDGDNIGLVGAGGVAIISHDAGKTWTHNNVSSDNGLFDVSLTKNKSLLVSGSVGTAAFFQDDTWSFADRTQLNLIAWLKTIIKLEGNSYLVAGGRGSLVLYRKGVWNKLILEELEK